MRKSPLADEMKVLLIVLNIAAALLIVPAIDLVHRMYTVQAMNMYVEFDRAGIIDMEKLTKMFPDYVEDGSFTVSRLAVSERFFKKKFPAFCMGVPCAIGFVMNAVLIGIFWKKQEAGGERITQ